MPRTGGICPAFNTDIIPRFYTIRIEKARSDYKTKVNLDGLPNSIGRYEIKL